MKRVETKRKRIESEFERRKLKRRHDSDEFKVVEGVIDTATLKTLYKLLNRGVLSALHGAISTGKEANVYYGIDSDGAPVAVKIYRVTTAESDYMLEYILSDPRFQHVKRKSRSLIPLWALKEFKNLLRYHEAGIRVPRPIDIARNIVVMEFIGDLETGLPAPLLKDVRLSDPSEVFNKIIDMIEMGVRKANLVHADLSAYNILWLGEPIFIDVSQSVLMEHDKARLYLYRDIQNITAYFQKLGVETEDPRTIFDYILSGE
ncbi:MAG: serine protein kinase RIO [Candidatus Thorarchaeota archaeon]|nr:serine protein kinase RIO [Candidatus Thorarchaeota archaeon]